MAGRAREINAAYRRAFGDRLRDIREDRGISQEALANETGVARSYLSSIERGLGNPALDLIARLAAGLEVQPGDLMPGIRSPRRGRRAQSRENQPPLGSP